MIQLHRTDYTILDFGSGILNFNSEFRNPNSAFVESSIQRIVCSSGAKFRGGDHDEW